MKLIRLSFLGLGVVGAQLMAYVRDSLEGKDFGDARISVDKVFVRNPAKKRGIDTTGLTLTDDPYEAIRDADIVAECMGGSGTEETRKLVLAALGDRKAVIMSSKKCLAQYGREIVGAVQTSGACFHYDATVGGGIPIGAVLTSMGIARRQRVSTASATPQPTSSLAKWPAERASSRRCGGSGAGLCRKRTFRGCGRSGRAV